jgi:hypothetical protein
MTEYVVELYTECRHKTRIHGTSPESVRDEIWQQLEEADTPEDIAGPAVDAYVQHIKVRELYDWEKT